MNEYVYVPILKWKKGEQEALKNLSEKQESRIIPLIEITDYEEATAILNSLTNSFSKSVYIDTSIAAEDDREYLLSIVEEFKANDKSIFPILYFDDLQDIGDQVADLATRVGLKIPVPEDIEGPNYEDIFEVIKNLKSKNDIIIDIILDLGVITEKKEASRAVRDIKDVIKQFLLSNSFCNYIIISLTSFPESISSIPAGGSASYPRYDITIFNKVLETPDFADIRSKLIYSDYGVTKFTETELDFSLLQHGILPKVKYTTYDKYLVYKGQRDRYTRQLIKGYRELAKEIFDSPSYFGESFSFGDLEIKERANGLNGKGPGNNTNWVTIAANHHIAVVIEQLSKNHGI